MEQARVMARLAWQRELEPDEAREISQFLADTATQNSTVARRKRLTALAQSVLISNEFHFID